MNFVFIFSAFIFFIKTFSKEEKDTFTETLRVQTDFQKYINRGPCFVKFATTWWYAISIFIVSSLFSFNLF